MSGATCPHCGNPSEANTPFAPFCCGGCQAVASLLADQKLNQFYDLGGRDGVPAALTTPRTLSWLDPMLAGGTPGGTRSLELDIQGLHCVGCVWLINELFRRRSHVGAININPALGKVRLNWREGQFDVRAFIGEVERFGYLFGPSRKEASRASRDLPLRIGLCAAIAMNVMMFSISFYVGLASGELFVLFSRLSLGLSTAAVAIGGWPFFKTAWQGLRRGVLHLDLPIAAGILLAFATSLLRSSSGRGDLAYFDTLDVFITLMLVGRWLQQRVLDRNRRFLLDDAGAEGIHVRREQAGRLSVIQAPAIRSGDTLLIAPGDLIPVDAMLLDASASISTDWINGESTPQRLELGAAIPAGAFNSARQAFRIRSSMDFSESPLIALLRAARDPSRDSSRAALIGKVSRYYVPVVLSLAAIGAWLWRGSGWEVSLDVAAGLLIVTCPCALGIAVPLAEELALAHLRRSGVLVRSADLFDRALNIRKVLFDKTGTLTLDRLVLVLPEALTQLDSESRNVLFDLAARSNHPVSKAIAEELRSSDARFSSDVEVHELPSLGLELRRDGHVWRLGKGSWACSGEDAPATAFTIDGTLLADLTTREAIRSDARDEIRALRASGLDVWLISGDATKKVAETAWLLSLPADRFLAEQTPEAKAEAVRRLDQGDALFIGDGVNDSLAFAAATATGTPAIDRPVMPAKADFFLLGAGISGVRKLLGITNLLRGTIRRILGIALAYNVLAVLACFAGLMTPLRAAVAMPASSIAVIVLAMASFSQRRLQQRGQDESGHATAGAVACTSS